MKSRKKIDFYKRIPRETIPTTFFSIFRNKRRSMAMLSGIIMFIVSSIEYEGMHTALWWLLGNTQIYDVKLLIFV